jgi:hypothetical protein
MRRTGNREQLNAKARRVAGLLGLITTLIIRDGGKLVCQLFFVGKLLIVGLLLGNWRVEGLDKRICWGF